MQFNNQHFLKISYCRCTPGWPIDPASEIIFVFKTCFQKKTFFSFGINQQYSYTCINKKNQPIHACTRTLLKSVPKRNALFTFHFILFRFHQNGVNFFSKFSIIVEGRNQLYFDGPKVDMVFDLGANNFSLICAPSLCPLLGKQFWERSLRNSCFLEEYNGRSWYHSRIYSSRLFSVFLKRIGVTEVVVFPKKDMWIDISAENLSLICILCCTLKSQNLCSLPLIWKQVLGWELPKFILLLISAREFILCIVKSF